MDRRQFLQSGSAFTIASVAAATIPWRPALAQGRQDTLLVVREGGGNMVDLQPPGPNRPAYGISWNIYDRLLTYGSKTTPDGQPSYDYTVLEPELAESWEEVDDGKAVLFKLRRDATFHDGTPVTAADVKYSLDRAVSVGGFSTFQMAAGSIEKPEQFEVIDDHTFKFHRLRADKLTLPDLAVPMPTIYNSKLVKQHATEKDPWALEWTKTNAAGGGAFKLERWEPGQQTVYTRFDDWKSGPLPALARVIEREVPSPSSRRALLEKGDVDISFDLPPKDFAELAEDPRFTVVGVLIENFYWYLSLNVEKEPFNNLKVRQALAHALPYEEIFNNAFYKRGRPLYGAASDQISTVEWPQPHWYKTDLDKAKALLAEAGYPDGFEAVMSLDIGTATVSEPMSLMIQDNFSKIGVRITLDKKPSSAFREAMVKKTMDMNLNNFGGWLNYPEYFFRWTHHGSKPLFNTANYASEKMDELIKAASYDASGAPYEEAVKAMIQLSFVDLPNIPIVQAFLDVAMQPNIKGYEFWFHRQLDYRTLSKA